MKEQFEAMDTNFDGKLTREEIVNYYKLLEMPDY